MSTLIATSELQYEIAPEFVGPPTQDAALAAKAAELNSPGSVLTGDEIDESTQVVPEMCGSELAKLDVSEQDLAHVVVSENDGTEPDTAPGTEQQTKQFAIVDVLKKFGSLSSIVRIAGVSAVVLSMCLFMLDGMGVVNDTQRFFTMLMLTGLLSAGGFSLAFLLKEQRGARSFFGLALLSVPVNFTVLSALFYSVFQFDSIATAYPTVAHWKIASIASLGSAALIAALALIPVTLIGISVMAREGRVWLSGALLASSSMLLLPIRDTSLIAPIVAVMVLALISLVKSRGEGIIYLKTPAGRFVQSLLFLPPAIMLFRSFWLYDVTALSALVIALTVYAAVRYASQRISPEGIVVNALHMVGITVALAAAVLSMNVVLGVTGSIYGMLVFCIVFGGLLFDVEHRVKDVNVSHKIGIGTSLVIAAVMLVHQQLYDGIIVFMIGLLIPVAIVVVGVVQKHKQKMLIGGLALVSVLLLNAGAMLDFLMHAGWLGFATLGAVAILAASLLERFGAMFSMQARKWFVAG